MLAGGLIISRRFVQVRIAPKHRSTQISNYQSSEHKSNSHDFSHGLKNKSNYSQIINMLMIRGVLKSIMDLNI